MRRIYTKTGDKGFTDLYGRVRVAKDSIRIEANGCIDELNSMIGIVRSFMVEEDEHQNLLTDIQREIMAIMSHVATPTGVENNTPMRIKENFIEHIETYMDMLMARQEKTRGFILPAGNLISAHLQYARTLARRAERRLWTLKREEGLDDDILIFFNRLSDLFFILAKDEMQKANLEQEDR